MPARACRGCLATDVRLYNIYKNNLYEDFGEIVGNPIFESDDLPQHICALCNAQLRKFVSFRNRVRVVQDMLEELPLKGIQPTTAYIKTIDRQKCNLLLNFDTPITYTLDLDAKFADLTPDETVVPTSIEPEQVCEELDQNAEVSEQTDNINTGLEPEPIDLWSPEPFDDNEFDVPPKTEPPATKFEMKPQDIVNEQTRMEQFKEKYNVDIVILTKEEQIEIIAQKLKQAADDWTTNACLYCSDCGKRVVSAKSLEEHRNKFHNESKGPACDICLIRTPKHKMRMHMRTHEMRIICKECGITSHSYPKAVNHARVHGLAPNKKWPCPYCDEEFDKTDIRKSHMQEKHEDMKMWCKFCGLMGLFETDVKRHIRKIHPEMMKSEHVCPKCEQPFASKEALEKHDTASCEDLCNCLVCGEHFETKGLLRDHVTVSHGKEKFIRLELCTGCGVNFFGSDALERHNASGQCGTCVHACVECGEMFNSVSSLNIHKSDFHKILIRACDTCGKAYDPPSYREHMQRIHYTKAEVKKIVVPRFMTRVWTAHGGIITSTNLVVSKKNHKDGDRPFMCAVCGKVFKKRLALKNHEGQHDASKRLFKCEYCEKAYVTKARLKIHTTIHTGEKPYACEFCPKRMRTINSRRNHIKTHLNMRPHICHMCGKKFRTSTCVKTHIRAVHLRLPTRGPKKWEMDRLKRLDQSIEDDDTPNLNRGGQLEVEDVINESQRFSGHMSETQEIAAALSHIGVTQEHIDDSQSHDEEQRRVGDVGVYQEHIEKSQGHMDESQGHMDESQGHVDRTQPRIRDINAVIPPEGYIDRETGLRVYPVKHKRKYASDTLTDNIINQKKPKTAGVRRKRRNIQSLVQAAEEVEKKPPIDDEENDEDDCCINEAPRVIKTIHIRRKKRVDQTQYHNTPMQDLYTNTDDTHKRLDAEQNTQYVVTHTRDYVNTNTDYIDVHNQDDQNNTLYINDTSAVFNTLTRDTNSNARVHKKKVIKNVRKVKGKSMPTLNLDDHANTGYMNTDVNVINDTQNTFNIDDYIAEDKPLNSSTHKQKVSTVVPSHSKRVSYGKQRPVLYENEAELGKKKYVVAANKRTTGIKSTSGKTGWN